MMSEHRTPDSHRRTRFETFEERLAMSAQPLADALTPEVGSVPWHYAERAPNLEPTLGDFARELGEYPGGAGEAIQPQLNDSFGASALEAIRSQYGFTGTGQTVAIIDSGIAYDHVALGGGLGRSYRVVGGWDFAENDADPYDDGPAGFHGTHVAGIVGSTDARYRGVAPGVDLVGLRVFDDNGAGFFQWTEQALRWVHEHRHDFEHPITTVNLSLGANWNGDTPPNWAMLEDEFAQLKSDGIFIAVSAGNSFTTYNKPGLSYPAASSHVVPVASVDNSGSLSYFSQRNARVIAAPGRSVMSTVPDYVLGADGIKNDFASASGTSMAAPYVAGAATLVREAMQFVGYAGITQDTIYGHMRQTADVIFDSATNASYHRLNLQRAIDTLMPADDFGDTPASAHALGTITHASRVEGRLGRLNDVDAFSFTAGQSGTMRIAVSSADRIALKGGLTDGRATLADGVMSFAVVAGESYSLSVRGDGALGSYSLEATLTPATVDLGTVGWFETSLRSSPAGGTWFQLKSSQSGYLTILAAGARTSDALGLTLYSAAGTTLLQATGTGTSQRLDAVVRGGESFFIRLDTTAPDTQLLVANLVALDGGILRVAGTDAGETYRVNLADASLAINQLAYSGRLTTGAAAIRIDGAGGHDTLIVQGGADAETATVQGNRVDLASPLRRLHAADIEASEIYSGGGFDALHAYGTAGDDRIDLHDDRIIVTGSGTTHVVHGYRQTRADVRQGGHDTAIFFDSARDDRFYASPDYSQMVGAGYDNCVVGAATTRVYARQGGADVAYFHDSAGDDRLYATPEYVQLITPRSDVLAHGFARTMAYADQGGSDAAYFTDSAGDDELHCASTWSEMRGADYDNYIRGFERVLAYAERGGYDRVYFYDSAGNDTLHTSAQWSEMLGAGFDNYARGFDQAFGYSGTGQDTVYFYDSPEDDEFTAWQGGAQLRGSQFELNSRGFAILRVYSSGGKDVAAVTAGSQLSGLNVSGPVVRTLLGADDLLLHSFAAIDFGERSEERERQDVAAVDGVFQGWDTDE